MQGATFFLEPKWSSWNHHENDVHATQPSWLNNFCAPLLRRVVELHEPASYCKWWPVTYSAKQVRLGCCMGQIMIWNLQARTSALGVWPFILGCVGRSSRIHKTDSAITLARTDLGFFLNLWRCDWLHLQGAAKPAAHCDGTVNNTFVCNLVPSKERPKWPCNTWTDQGWLNKVTGLFQASWVCYCFAWIKNSDHV